MPATERRFSEIPPARLYVDTDVLISYLVASQPHHQRSREFFQRIAEHGLTRVYVSSLTWIEFAHVVTRERFRRALPEKLQGDLHLDHWSDRLIRQTYLQTFLDSLEDLLGQFDWSEVFIGSSIRRAAVEYIGTYNLGAQDAVHLACATAAEVLDLASFDKGFRSVDGLYLWNDLIHTDAQ